MSVTNAYKPDSVVGKKELVPGTIQSCYVDARSTFIMVDGAWKNNSGAEYSGHSRRDFKMPSDNNIRFGKSSLNQPAGLALRTDWGCLVQGHDMYKLAIHLHGLNK